MNILFVNQTPFNPSYGGVERVTDLLTKELFKRGGFNIFYLCAEADKKLLTYDFPTVQDVLPYEDGFANLQNVEYYKQYLKENKIDVVINQRGLVFKSGGWEPFMKGVLKVNGIKTISVIHTLPYGPHIMYIDGIFRHDKNFNGYIRYIIKILMYPIYYAYKYIKSLYKLKKYYTDVISCSAAVVLLSNKCIIELEQLVNFPNKHDKLHYIPNPNAIDINKNSRNYKENIILYVGRLHNSEKKPIRLLKIWHMIYKKHPLWKLYFVGSGDQLYEMNRFVEEHNIERVYFEGHKENVSEYYLKADFICLTSDYEGWGLTLTEGMSYGCIPFTFNNYGAASEIIDDGINGCLIPAYDLNSYAERLSFLIDNCDCRERMAKEAQNKVAAFNVNRVVNKWVELFNSLIIES